MTLDEAMRVFDLSANRTHPNQQTQAWEVIRAAMIDLLALQDRVNDAPVGVWSELTETDGVITSAHLSNRLPFHTLAEGQRVKLVLVPEADSGGEG